MKLSKQSLSAIGDKVVKPEHNVFDLPEKVLQFGTGVLLRGLPAYFIDKANRAGIFNGRIVVVKSTDKGDTQAFDEQDGLYTLHIRGIQNGDEVNEDIISSAISRVVSASTQWDDILKVAESKDLKVIISNTTEVGIQLVANDNINATPPASFPGKLLPVLYHRFKTFKGSGDSGLVIVPTELIVDNGKKLEGIVLELAHLNKMEPEFMDWLEQHNHFCSSLVDRIVPGKPDATTHQLLDNELGYEDDLRIIAEPYTLWAIEGYAEVADVLTFAQADSGVVIAADIEKFRELKLRLLNATHTLSCAVAFLKGFETVSDALSNNKFEQFITELMLTEIAPSIPFEIALAEKEDYAKQVLDRFRNPSLQHKWISISLQYSSKIKLRVLPLLFKHYQTSSSAPELISEGIAAFIRFMKIDDQLKGHINGREYNVADDNAVIFHYAWKDADAEQAVKSILSNKQLWDTDLTTLPGFEKTVLEHLKAIDDLSIKTEERSIDRV